MLTLFKRLFLPTLLALLMTFVVPYWTLSQVGLCHSNTSQKPISVSKLNQKGMMPAPQELQKYGIFFFDLTIIPLSQIEMNLYDESMKLQATVKLVEDRSQDTDTYTIQLANHQPSFVQVKSQVKDSEYSYLLSSSLGVSLRVSIEAEQKGDHSLVVKQVKVDQGKGFSVLSLDELKNPGNPLSLVQDQVIFASSDLKILQVVLRNFKSMMDQLQNSTEALYSGECNVRCYRIQEIIPLYYCNGGAGGCCSEGNGFFLVSCGVYSICNLPCSAFGPIT